MDLCKHCNVSKQTVTWVVLVHIRFRCAACFMLVLDQVISWSLNVSVQLRMLSVLNVIMQYSVWTVRRILIFKASKHCCGGPEQWEVALVCVFGSLSIQCLVPRWEISCYIQSTNSLWSRVLMQPQWYNTHYNWNWIIRLERGEPFLRTTSPNYNDNMPIYIMIMHILTAKHVCFALVFIAGHGEFKNYKRVFSSLHYCSEVVIEGTKWKKKPSCFYERD